MHKQKTKAGAKKRFKISGNGTIRRKHAYKSHLLGCKTKRQKRELGKFVEVHKSNLDTVKRALALK